MPHNFHINISKCKDRASTYQLLNYLSRALKLREEVLALPKVKTKDLNNLMCSCI